MNGSYIPLGIRIILVHHQKDWRSQEIKRSEGKERI